MRYLLLTTLMATLCLDITAQSFTPHSEKSQIQFEIKNFGATVKGTFNGLNGTINFEPDKVSLSSFDVTIDAASINTGIKMRDNHLRKSEYFDVTKFATIRFVSTKVIPSAKPAEATVIGNLTIKNITKEISFPFTHKATAGVVQFSGSFKIDRRDFGVGGNSISMADELTVKLDVVATK